METYQISKIRNPSTNVPIIEDVRDFRFKIISSLDQIAVIQKDMSQLNNDLILQDLDNAVKLLTRKSENMKARVSNIRELCNKITQAGQDLDGNTSNKDEEEFVDALTDEMPTLHGDLDVIEEGIEQLVLKLKEVQQSENPNDLLKAKDEFDKLYK